MHAFLFVGNDFETRKKAIEEFVHQKGWKVLEFPITKINDVRELASFTKLSGSEPTAILINYVENSTNEALNAFLKNLEEPSENIFYILNAKSEYSILPTIVSRCEVVRTKGKGQRAKDKEDAAESFLKKSIGEKFTYLSKAAKREEAIDLVERIVTGAHQEMIEAKANLREIVDLVRAGQDALNNLNLNANVSLQLTNLAVKTSVRSI